jgi:hypothetical protein
MVTTRYVLKPKKQKSLPAEMRLFESYEDAESFALLDAGESYDIVTVRLSPCGATKQSEVESEKL